jgi:hypothetical protein
MVSIFYDFRYYYCHRFAALRSGDEPRPSLHKYNQNFQLITFQISDKSHASPFLKTAVVGSFLFIKDVLSKFFFQV